MSDPPVVPRPAAAGDGSALAERLRALRGDARVGIAVLALRLGRGRRRVVPGRDRAGFARRETGAWIGVDR